MTLLEWAITYARRGWPVFPCHPKTKRPLCKGDVDADGKEIPNTGGVKKATCDEATIRAWWTKWPRAMIGLATGARAGVFVVDVDAGEDSKTGEVFEAGALLRQLYRELNDDLPDTWWTKTPRGGRHLFFQFPADDPIGNRTAIIERVDIRGEGGYVILPPSARDDGKAYAWGAKPKITGELPGKAPPALIDCIQRRGKWESTPPPAAAKPRSISERAAVRAPGAAARGVSAPERTRVDSDQIDGAVSAYAIAAFNAEVLAVEQAGRGERNNRLNLAALRLGELVHVGAFSEGQVEAALFDAAERSGIVKEDGARPCRATITSGLSKGLQQPRDLTEVRAKAAERIARYGPRRGDVGASAGALGPSPPPPDGADFDATLPSGRQRTRSPAGSGGGRGKKPPAGGDDDDEAERQQGLHAELAFLPMTDLGNVHRFARRAEGRFKWCSAIGWIWWDHWRWNGEGADAKVLAAEHDTVRAIQAEAEWLANSDKDVVVDERKAPGRREKGEPEPEPITVMMSDKLARFGRASESKPRMRLADDAKAYLSIPASVLDADPFKINCRNGTVTVRRGPDGAAVVSFDPHNPDDLITKIAPIDYDPEATCPTYDAFLELVQPVAETGRFVAQWGGYSLTGDTSEQIFTFNWGKGKNGKSTLFNAWGYVAGDYGRSIRIETFLDQGKSSNGGAPTPDLAMLKGVRYLRTSEPERGAKLAEALIKLATGGEPLNVRHLNREFFELLPAFKLTMSGNYKPTIIGTDEGIWRRVKLVPWTVEIPEAQRIKDFDRLKLFPEAAGIFNRLLAGLCDWLEHGLIEPAQVHQATAEYRTDSDPLGRFLAACTVLSPGDREQSSALHKLFVAWARANGEKEWTATGFGRAMRERGYTSHHSDVNWWVGVKAIRTINDFVDNDGNPLSDRKKREPDGDGGPDDVVPL